MIMNFRSYESADDIKNFLKLGDRVVVTYKDSKHFMKTGKVINIKTAGTNIGDCNVLMDYNNNYVLFYYTNIEKILDLIGVPSGEVLYVTLKDSQRLSSEGLIHYSANGNFYFYKDEDKWQVESDAI